jgi:uncharacterized protein YbjT (DUF2867 family)
MDIRPELALRFQCNLGIIVCVIIIVTSHKMGDTMAKTILILGGTGLLGSYAARHLQQAGFSVRILARNVEKAQRMFDDAFEIVPGDANNTAAVRTALEGCYGAHISLSEAGDLQGTRHVTVYASELGLEHITYVSGVTVDESRRWFPMIADKLQAEAAVRDTGLPYTIFCPTWFFEVAHNNFIQETRAIRIGKHATPYHWLAAADFGRMVAQAYQTEAAQNKRLYILGPEALMFDDVLKHICARLYPQITSVKPIPVWLAKLIARVTGNAHMLAGSHQMAYYDKIEVESLADPTEANALLGAPTTTLDMWLDTQTANTG